MKKVVTKSLQETHAVAADFMTWLALRPAQDRATVVALRGDLGAGKTAFVQGIAKALSVDENITSPTFVLMKQYVVEARGKKQEARIRNLIHIDAYRLGTGADLEPLRWQELTTDPGNLIVIEWPERVIDALPDTTLTLEFTFVDESTREIVVPTLDS